ncbi:hypothetical protein HK105_203902 [Polyrhizophydium stewartii]|uniref:Ubiquitin-like domain-containing protein n=1 Tax=Polyrhizophydium stewartii TaxID=2732419 RepID=A0ABR4NAG9_9FUNG
MIVLVKTLVGRPYMVFSLSMDSTVLDVKRAVEKKHSLHSSQQRLIFGRRILGDDELLVDTGYTSGALMYMTLTAIPGGGVSGYYISYSGPPAMVARVDAGATVAELCDQIQRRLGHERNRFRVLEESGLALMDLGIRPMSSINMHAAEDGVGQKRTRISDLYYGGYEDSVAREICTLDHTLTLDHPPHVQIARKSFFREHRPIPYNALEDPALEEFFSRPQVQRHLKKNGWCNKCDRGPIKICKSCQRFFHVSCLPSLPITKTNLSVLVIHCNHASIDISPMHQILLADGHFSRVDMIDAQSLKPRTPDLLKSYDAVLVLALNKENSNSPSLTGGWPEPDALGDLLADFVIRPRDDEAESSVSHPGVRPAPVHRGGVVLGPLTHWETIGGRWRKHKIAPLLPGRQKHTPHLVLGKVDHKGHAVMSGVERFAGGDTSYHVTGAVNEAGACEIARWSNGLPLVVVLEDHPMVDRGRVISLNYCPIAECIVKEHGKPNLFTMWDKTTDGYRLLSNALRFVAEPTYQTTEGELVCKDCTNGTRAPKVVPKMYQEERPPRPIRRAKSAAYAVHYSDDPEQPINHQLRVRIQRERALAKLEVLKERFRKQFREQIMYSERKKRTADSPMTKILEIVTLPAIDQSFDGSVGFGASVLAKEPDEKQPESQESEQRPARPKRPKRAASVATVPEETLVEDPVGISPSAFGELGAAGISDPEVAPTTAMPTSISETSDSRREIAASEEPAILANDSTDEAPARQSTAVLRSDNAAGEPVIPSQTRASSSSDIGQAGKPLSEGASKPPSRIGSRTVSFVSLSSKRDSVRRDSQTKQELDVLQGAEAALSITPKQIVSRPSSRATSIISMDVGSGNETPSAHGADADGTDAQPSLKKSESKKSIKSLHGSKNALAADAEPSAHIADADGADAQASLKKSESKKSVKSLHGSKNALAADAEPSAHIADADGADAQASLKKSESKKSVKSLHGSKNALASDAEPSTHSADSHDADAQPSLKKSESKKSVKSLHGSKNALAPDAEPSTHGADADGADAQASLKKSESKKSVKSLHGSKNALASDAEPSTHSADSHDADAQPSLKKSESKKSVKSLHGSKNALASDAEPSTHGADADGADAQPSLKKSESKKTKSLHGSKNALASDAEPTAHSADSHDADAQPSLKRSESKKSVKSLHGSKNALASDAEPSTHGADADGADAQASLKKSESKKSVKSLHGSKNALASDAEPSTHSADSHDADAQPSLKKSESKKSVKSLHGSKNALAPDAEPSTHGADADGADAQASLKKSESKKSVKSLHGSKNALASDAEPSTHSADSHDADAQPSLKKSESKKSAKSLHGSKNALASESKKSVKSLHGSKNALASDAEPTAHSADSHDADAQPSLKKSESKKSVKSLHGSRMRSHAQPSLKKSESKKSAKSLHGSKNALASDAEPSAHIADADGADAQASLKKSESKKSVKSLHGSKNALASDAEPSTHSADSHDADAQPSLKKSESKKSAKSLHGSKNALASDAEPTAHSADSHDADAQPSLKRSESKKSVKSLHGSKNALASDAEPTAHSADSHDADAQPSLKKSESKKSVKSLHGSKNALASDAEPSTHGADADGADAQPSLKKSESKKSAKSLHGSKNALASDAEPSAHNADSHDADAQPSLKKSDSKKSVKSLHGSKNALAADAEPSTHGADSHDADAQPSLKKSESKKSAKSLHGSKNALAADAEHSVSKAPGQTEKQSAPTAHVSN